MWRGTRPKWQLCPANSATARAGVSGGRVTLFITHYTPQRLRLCTSSPDPSRCFTSPPPPTQHAHTAHPLHCIPGRVGVPGTHRVTRGRANLCKLSITEFVTHLLPVIGRAREERFKLSIEMINLNKLSVNVNSLYICFPWQVGQDMEVQDTGNGGLTYTNWM